MSAVEQVELGLEGYYQALPDLMDSDEYRSAHGVVLIKGELFDQTAGSSETFEVATAKMAPTPG